MHDREAFLLLLGRINAHARMILLWYPERQNNKSENLEKDSALENIVNFYYDYSALLTNEAIEKRSDVKFNITITIDMETLTEAWM